MTACPRALRSLLSVALAGPFVVAVAVSSTANAASPARDAPVSDSSRAPVVYSCPQHVRPGQHTCFAMRRTDVGTRSSGFTAQHYLAARRALPEGYGPADLQSAYQLATAAATEGAGRRVYIVDAFHDPHAGPDMAVYRSTYGLPPCTKANGCFQQLNQSGQPGNYPATGRGWAGEISLDLDMVSAICPDCAITLVEARNSGGGLYKAVKTATRLGAHYVSMSWGGPEDGAEATYDALYYSTPGVVYTASTGDDAYQAGVEYPATSPNVIAVGGTSLTRSTTTRGWVERAWHNDYTDGTGSGCSGDEGKPPWQTLVSTSVCGRRAESDVSAVADPNTGVAVYQTFGGSGWTVYGGTSAATPIIAAVYALAGVPAPSDRPGSFLYVNRSSLNDVVRGTTGLCLEPLLCSAATGWDGPTGLGTPNGTAAFVPPPPAATASCSGKVLNGGFESGGLFWSRSRGVVRTDGIFGRSGLGYAWLGGYNSAHVDRLAQGVSIPAGCTATLTYWVKIHTLDVSGAAHDTMTLTANGAPLEQVCNLDHSYGYVEHSVSLANFAGDTVTLEWIGREDATLRTSFFVDDVSLTLSPITQVRHKKP